MTNCEVVHLDSIHNCPRSDYLGKFPVESDYDRVITENCDVYVAGRKVVSFRKSMFQDLSREVPHRQEVWDFFRAASREVYGTQRGIVAGNELTTRPESRLTKGQVAFFTQSAAGLITTLEQANELLESSKELTTKTLKIKHIKKAYPEIALELKPLESLIKKEQDSEKLVALRNKRREVLWSWFTPWLQNHWLPSSDKVSETKKVLNDFVSSQLNFNHCYSNVLGAIDRGSRFPYGRLSGTTERHYEQFVKFKSVYFSACDGLKQTFPEEWEFIKETISRVKDPNYNLFGTAFTSLTLNFNFRTAYHTDKNNLKGGLAVLTVLSKGSYDGHYLIFPELRLAFDVRDGDFIAGDTQTLLHGNNPMTEKSEDAERISLVFYSRENMVRLDSLECETCRRGFMKYSLNNLKGSSKEHKEWRGVWPGMWTSQEWHDYRAQRNMEHCSNSNWQLSAPYLNSSTSEVKLFKDNPGEDWKLIQVWEQNQ